MKRQFNSEKLLNYRTYIGLITVIVLTISSGLASIMLSDRVVTGFIIASLVIGFFIVLTLLLVLISLIVKLNKEAKIIDDTE